MSTIPLVASLPRVTDEREIGQSAHPEWAQKRVAELFSACRHWSVVADALAPYLRLSPVSWWHVAHGRKISLRKINALRQYDGLAPLPELVKVEPCPTCKQVHAAGDCHGKPVASVAILAPGEAVAPVERIAGDGQVIRPEPKPHKRQPRTSIEVRRETHALLNKLRRPGETWDTFLFRLSIITMPD